MKKGFISIGVVVVAVALALGVVVGYKEYKNPAEETFSAFRPSSYTGKLLTRLNEGGSETTFNTTPGTAKDGSSLTTTKIGDFIVITINPGADNEEKISASAVSVSGTTATWTIINRGLSFTENAQVTANIKQHAIGETVIISNDDHYLYSQYVNVDDAQTISGIKTFSVSPIVPTPTTDMQAATKKYADDLAIAGSPDATITVKGISELATQIEMASSTPLGGTGASLVLQSQYATSTPTLTGLYIPVSENDGKLNQSWLDLSEVFSFSGNNSFSGTSLFTASSTFTATTSILANSLNNALILNGIDYVFPSSEGSANTVLTENGSGSLSWSSYKYLNASTTGTTVTNSTTETNLYSYTIPANTLGTSNLLKFKLNVTDFDNDYSNSGGGENNVIKVYYGATAIATFTIAAVNDVTYGKDMSGWINCYVLASGTTNSQSSVCTIDFLRNGIDAVGTSNVRLSETGTASIDSTSAQLFRVTATLGSTNDNYSIATGFGLLEVSK
jgi:hypothetical protein